MPYYYFLLLEKARSIYAILGRGGVIYIISSLKIDSESIRFNTLQFWHQFISIRDIAYFCQAWSEAYLATKTQPLYPHSSHV